MDAYPLSGLHIAGVGGKITIGKLDLIMDLSWVIMSTWIEVRRHQQVLGQHGNRRVSQIDQGHPQAHHRRRPSSQTAIGYDKEFEGGRVLLPPRAWEMRETHKVGNSMCPDFVNMHNGFDFDLRRREGGRQIRSATQDIIKSEVLEMGMLDGDSLYGSLMKHLQMYMCTGARPQPTIESLRRKTYVVLPDHVEDVEVNKVVPNEAVIVIKTKRALSRCPPR
ncbi:hypothetical protein AK830_g4242 [Neonectria ditissima]|uniref:Uncharacterized protein n=1 Tax=Neonectria ditissima TaxID=78410 RepID=A0A0P7B992_9HYPO|nr:hypothetical protein AK830_g4242 [Neonectria ditissima]